MAADSNGFKPSAFQEAIFSFITDRDPQKRDGTVNAVAGSGKTTTLVHAAKLIDIPGLFCAFNKHIAEALQQRLRGTQMVTSTIHSLGMRTLGKGIPMGKNSSPDDMQQEQNLRYVAITRSLDTVHLLKSAK